MSSSSVPAPPSAPDWDCAKDDGAPPSEVAAWDALDWLTLLFSGTPIGTGAVAVALPCPLLADEAVLALSGAAGLPLPLLLDLLVLDDALDDLDEEVEPLRLLLLLVAPLLLLGLLGVPGGLTTEGAFALLLELLLLPPSSDFQNGIAIVRYAACPSILLCCPVSSLNCPISWRKRGCSTGRDLAKLDASYVAAATLLVVNCRGQIS